jgi:hypothetical protein
MKSGYRADVEAAKLRSLLARRHVDAGHFGQVLVTGDARNLRPQVADGHELKGNQEQCGYHSEWSSGHVRHSKKDDDSRQFAECKPFYTSPSRIATSSVG